MRSQSSTRHDAGVRRAGNLVIQAIPRGAPKSYTSLMSSAKSWSGWWRMEFRMMWHSRAS